MYRNFHSIIVNKTPLATRIFLALLLAGCTTVYEVEDLDGVVEYRRDCTSTWEDHPVYGRVLIVECYRCGERVYGVMAARMTKLHARTYFPLDCILK